MAKRKCIMLAGIASLAALIGLGAVAGAQQGGQPGTPVAENYKGLTTDRSYQPTPKVDAGEGGTSRTYPSVRVAPIGDQLRMDYRIDPFYKKALTIGSIVVIGSDRVSDWAMLEAAYTFDHQLHDSPQWVHDALSTSKVRHAILAVVEYTMDLPENNRNGRNSAVADGAYQDRRSRGLGGLPQCSSGEENLLNLRGDPYGGNGGQGSGENITIHEFSHTVASAIAAVQGRDGPFWTRLRGALAAAKAPGGRLEIFNRNRADNPVYASTNEQEYWAEGAQAWFDNANPNNAGGIATREQVKEKDPLLAALLIEIYGDGPWRYIKTTARKPDGSMLRPKEELAHLEGLDELRPQIPAFNFNNSPRIIAARQQGIQPAAPARGAANR